MSPTRSTRGASILVRFGETPADVPDEVISFLHNSQDPETKHHVSGESFFQAHETVEIVSGPFAGLPRIYQMPKGEDRAIVLIAVLGRQKKTLLHQDNLAGWPVDDDREHLRYLLIDRRCSTEQVVNGLFIAALLLGGVGMALYYLGVSESWSYVVFMSVCVGYFVWTNRMVPRTSG